MTNQDFISNYRNAVNALLDARASLKSYREMDTANGVVASFQAGDFAGTNSDLTAAVMASALSAMDSLEMLLTDFTKVPPVPTAALATLLKFRGGEVRFWLDLSLRSRRRMRSFGTLFR